MRILILAGTGFIGAAVARRLHAAGHAVTVGHTGQHEADLPAGVAHLHHPALARVERRNLDAVIPGVRRLAPEVVVDMTLLTEADANATVGAVRGIVGRLVVISSVNVYRAMGVLNRFEPGPPDPVPLNEDAPLRQRRYPFRGPAARRADDPERWRDNAEQVLVERAVQGQPTLPATILRLPAVYGPGDRQHRLSPYLKRMDDARPAIALAASLAAWRCTRGYVEDVVACIARAATDERAAGRVYNVGEPEALSEAAWARRIGAAAGWQGEIVVVPDEFLPASQRPPIRTEQHIAVDTSRFRRELGHEEPVPLDEALWRTVAWERANPPEDMDARHVDYAAEDAVLARKRHGPYQRRPAPR